MTLREGVRSRRPRRLHAVRGVNGFGGPSRPGPPPSFYPAQQAACASVDTSATSSSTV